MKEFKPNKTKAILGAGLQVAYDQADKIIEPLTIAWPNAALPLRLLQMNFGVTIAYKQEKLNQFTQYLMDNQDIFTEDLFQSSEFQDGLIVFIDSYFKLRSNEKLKLAQNIFYDFAVNGNKTIYPLERYDDTLEKISHNGIRFLGFIHSEVPKIKRHYVEVKIREHGNSLKNKPFDEWLQVYGSESLETFIEEYISVQTTHRMKLYRGHEPLVEENRIKDQMRNEFGEVKGELEQLGLAKGGRTEGGWSLGQSTFNLTTYGRLFTSIIQPETSDLIQAS